MRCIPAVLVFGCALALPVAAGAADALHLDIGQPLHFEGSGGFRDSILTWGDGEYESGLGWQYGGVAPPDYGSFAECFSGEWLLLSVVLDFTRMPDLDEGHTYDAYAWDNREGIPGTVLALVTGLDPGTIPNYPEYSRHFAQFPEPLPIAGDWWVGFWPNWPGQSAGWFLACDHNGPISGCMMTKVAPGLGYPTGWYPVSGIWGPHTSIGVSAEVRSVLPNPIETVRWGGVKALFH